MCQSGASKIRNFQNKTKQRKTLQGNRFIFCRNILGIILGFKNHCFRKISFKILQQVPLADTLCDKNRYTFYMCLNF